MPPATSSPPATTLLPATSSTTSWAMAHNNNSEHRCIDRGTGTSTGGGCIDHRASVLTGGGCINNRACILTGGMHINSKAGVSTTGQVYRRWGRCTDDRAGALTVGMHINGRMGIPIVWQTYQQRLGMSSGGGCLDSWVGILMMSRCILTFINPQPKATLLAQQDVRRCFTHTLPCWLHSFCKPVN